MNQDKTDASANEIFRFCNHKVKEFRDYKRAFTERGIDKKLIIMFDNISNINKIQQNKIPMKNEFRSGTKRQPKKIKNAKIC